MLVGVRRLDFAPPHLLDGREIDLVDRHAYPISLSNTTMVAMPAAMSTTWRTRVRVDLAAVQIGNQIRHRDVQQAGGREREHVRPDARDDADGAEGDQRADEAGRAGDDVQQQRAAAAVAGGEQDRDVADFLRNLVRGDGDGRVDAERHRRQHGRADDRAVDEVVERVADDDERRRRAVHLALVGVAVAEQHQLLEHEEREDAARAACRTRARGVSGVERFGQQRQQRDAEQRADRVADQPRHQPRADAVGEEEERGGDEQAAAAAEEAQAERGREQRHATFYAS